MLRFYRTGTCDWCHRHHLKVFLTTYESEHNKLMCERCKDIIEHKVLVSDCIEYAVDLWDETAPSHLHKTSEVDERFNTSKRPNKFEIKRSPKGKVRLYGFKDQTKFVVEAEYERTLQLEKTRVWEYDHLAPASRRFSSEVSKCE